MCIKSDQTLCPECGQANHCQSTLVKNSSEGMIKSEFSCWCQGVSLNEKARLALKNRFLSERCLCQNCIKVFNERYS